MTKESISTFAALALGSTLLLTPAALSGATTDPVGYTTVTIPSGTSIVSIPMEKSPEFVGPLTSVNGTTLGADVGSLPNVPLYVLVVSSSSALGELATVVSSSPTTLEIGNAIAGLAEGDVVKVVPHFTLSDIKASAGEFPDGTTLTVYDPLDGSESFEYISGPSLGAAVGEGVWADEGGGDASNVPFRPAEGFVISSGLESSVVFVGAVNVDSVVSYQGSGISVVGTNSPSDAATVAERFEDLAVGSLVTVYSNDGSLTISETYEVFLASDFGLGNGKVFVTGGGELGDLDELASGNGFVITPAPDANGFVIPPSFSSTSN
jgi:hypothetical protein